MTLSDYDKLKLRTYCQQIISNPRPLEAQFYRREGAFLWCEDWEIIEILKYLFLGRELYHGDPPPNRLKNNPLWSKEEIEKKAERYMEDHQNADAIIGELRAIRDRKT